MVARTDPPCSLSFGPIRYTKELAASVPERYPGQRGEAGTSDLVFPYSLYFVYYEQYTYVQVSRSFPNMIPGRDRGPFFFPHAGLMTLSLSHRFWKPPPQGVALTNVLVALSAVFVCTAALTGGDWATAAWVVSSVLGVVLGVVGVLALWNRAVRKVGGLGPLAEVCAHVQMRRRYAPCHRPLLAH